VLVGNKFTHFILGAGAAATDMVAILGGKNRYVTFFFWWHLPLASLFPDDPHRPREMLK